jgi:hypothetical protein
MAGPASKRQGLWPSGSGSDLAIAPGQAVRWLMTGSVVWAHAVAISLNTRGGLVRGWFPRPLHKSPDQILRLACVSDF